jgi:hypothetical protein
MARTRAQPRNLHGAIYGTVLALSVTAVSSEKESDVQVFVSVLATSFVFWIVHVYAGVVAARLEHGGQIMASIREEGRREWPLVQAAVPILVPLFLGAVGIVGQETGYWAALVVGVVVLAGFGVRIVRHEGGSTLAAVVVGTINVLFGLSLVLLKVLVH